MKITEKLKTLKYHYIFDEDETLFEEGQSAEILKIISLIKII